MTRVLDKVLAASFIVAIVIISVIYGVVAQRYGLFPSPVLVAAHAALEEQIAPPHHLFPMRYRHLGVSAHAPEAMSPGLTLLTSYWPEMGWLPGARLINRNGKVLHRWRVDPATIWQAFPHTDSMGDGRASKLNYIHGTYLFANGDLLLNIEYLGLFRIDACGNTVWSLPYRTHHSISRNANGTFWVSAMRWIDPGTQRAAQLPGLTPPFAEDMAILVSPEGKLLREISFLQAIYFSPYKSLLWRFDRRTGDIFHLNDVEALDMELAARFPMFAPGDLLVSLSSLSTVAVLDVSGRIKWLVSDIFVGQHDPDFADDGRIAVFDNRTDGTDRGKYLGGSIISSISPVSGDVRTIYESTGPEPFFTKTGGKHQRLQNGNLLITELRAGRVFEVDPAGRTVWQWVQEPYDDELVPEVLEGTRYDLSAANVGKWPCE